MLPTIAEIKCNSIRIMQERLLLRKNFINAIYNFYFLLIDIQFQFIFISDNKLESA